MKLDELKAGYVNCQINGDTETAARYRAAINRCMKLGIDAIQFSEEKKREESGLSLCLFAQRAIIAHNMQEIMENKTIRWERAYFVKGNAGLWGYTDKSSFKSALYRGEETKKGFKLVVLENGKQIFNPVYLIRDEFGTTNGENNGNSYYSLSFLRRTGEKLSIVPLFGRMSDSSFKLWCGNSMEGENNGDTPIIPVRYTETEVNDMVEKGILPKFTVRKEVKDKKGATIAESQEIEYKRYQNKLEYDREVSERARLLYKIGYNAALYIKRAKNIADINEKIENIDYNTANYPKEAKNQGYAVLFRAVIVILSAFYADYVVEKGNVSSVSYVPLPDSGKLRISRMVNTLGSVGDGRKYFNNEMVKLRRHGMGVRILYLDLLNRIACIDEAKQDTSFVIGDEFICYEHMIRSAYRFLCEKYDLI